MADGTTRAIEDVEIGDKVMAADPDTGELSARTVTAEITGNGEKDLVEVTIGTDDGSGADRSVIVATDGHPFWVDTTGEWTDAADLVPGQRLLTGTGDRVTIAAVRHYTRSTEVHNLTVADLHTYHVLAGETPVLVHNTGGSDDPGSFSGTVFRDGKYRFQIYSNDHGPAHGHLIGPGIKGDGIQIGQNGKPLDPKVQLTKDQQRVIDNNLRDIRKAIRKSMAAHRLAGGNGC